MSLNHGCLVCGAKRGEQCRNTIKQGEPLPGRSEHFARALPKLAGKDDDE